MLLALDTSTSTASLALVSCVSSGLPAQTLAELDWSVEQRHSTEALQRLEWILEVTGTRMEQLTGIAVATGPGSFNGLRVALSTAKSLSLALDVALYGVPTLDVCAWGYAYAAGPIWALLEGGRGQVYAARYVGPARSAEEWKPVGEYAVLTPEELAVRVLEDAEGALFCGEWRPETRAALEAHLAGLSTRVCFASRLRLRRAVWLAELALARATQGIRDDPSTLEPLYLRRPAITTSRKRGIAPPTPFPANGVGGAQ
jgi:tRNA threonylcarbamoyladenosine biosynthesis protein TsaB